MCVRADDALISQDDIWMLDGDDSQEPLSRVPRPDRLDFLRITPPEDDIVGDTPYYPNLDCTVSRPSLCSRAGAHILDFSHTYILCIQLILLLILPSW